MSFKYMGRKAIGRETSTGSGKKACTAGTGKQMMGCVGVRDEIGEITNADILESIGGHFQKMMPFLN